MSAVKTFRTAGRKVCPGLAAVEWSKEDGFDYFENHTAIRHPNGNAVGDVMVSGTWSPEDSYPADCDVVIRWGGSELVIPSEFAHAVADAVHRAAVVGDLIADPLPLGGVK